MGNPTPSTTLSTLRPDLAPFVEFNLVEQREGYIARDVLKPIDVALQSDNPGKIPVEALLQGMNGTEDARAGNGGYMRLGWNFEKFTYATEEHGVEVPVSHRDRNRYANFMDAEAVSTQIAAARVLGNFEARASSLLFNATTWTGAALTTAITNEWDDAANATPIVDVKAAKAKVFDGSGLNANALIINQTVFENLRQCTSVLDRIAASGAGFPNRTRDVTRMQLAELFDLDYIIVAGAAKNTANKGQAAAFSRFWSGEYAMVARIAVGNDIREPCVARAYHWTGDGSSLDGTVESFENTNRETVVRVRMDTDEVVMYAAAAHLLSNITT